MNLFCPEPLQSPSQELAGEEGVHSVSFLDAGFSDGRQEGSHSRKLGSKQRGDELTFESVKMLNGQVQS